MFPGIRPFSFEDLEVVSALVGELGYPTSADKMRKRMEALESHPDYRTFVAELDGKVVGMIGVCRKIMYESDDAFVQITALVTSSQYRGQGLVKVPVCASEEWARTQQAAGIYLTSGIKPERSYAHDFYKHLGYKITGYRFFKALE